MSDKNTEIIFHGLGVSQGIAHAKVYLVGNKFIEPISYRVNNAEKEIERLEQALELTFRQITDFKEKLSKGENKHYESIFDAHLLILNDKLVLNEVKKKILEAGLNADTIYYQVMDKYAKSLHQIDDFYLRDRAFDIRDVSRRVINNLQGYREIKKHKIVNFQHIIIAQDRKSTRLNSSH